jgi:hypothetical protein
MDKELRSVANAAAGDYLPGSSAKDTNIESQRSSSYILDVETQSFREIQVVASN